MRAALLTRPHSGPATGNCDDDVVHVVGDLEHWVSLLLRRVPTALCGVLLEGDDPPDDAPDCPRCVELER